MPVRPRYSRTENQWRCEQFIQDKTLQRVFQERPLPVRVQMQLRPPRNGEKHISEVETDEAK
jgi:hypothetical protein